MAYADEMFLPVQSALLGCLITATDGLTTPPAIVAPRYGQEVVFDLAQNEDLCCDGFAWVRLGTATPDFGSQPSPCGPLAWRLQLEVGIVTCAPMGDDQNVVTEAQHLAANATMAEIMVALRRVICCFGELDYVFEVGPISPAGPTGGCMGASMMITVNIVGQDDFAAPVIPPDGPVFPLAPYVLGVDVGVPTGTVLTPTTGLPVPDAIEELLITHPITGAQRLLTGVKVWRHREWAATIQPHPGPGETFLFDECRFAVELDNFCVDLIDDNGVLDIMAPLLYLRRCTGTGNNTTSRVLNAAFTWVWECDLRDTEDAWGTAYGVAYRSNLIAGQDTGVDPHPDGLQIGGLGFVDVKLCYLSAGSAIIGNSAFRAGTDFSHIEAVRIHDCALTLGGYNLQVRGDPGGRGVNNIEVLRCTFGPWGFGAADFQDVTAITWTSNVDIDGNPVPSP